MTAGMTTTARAMRRSPWVAMAAAATLALGACAGGGDGDASEEVTGGESGSPSPSASAATPDEVETTPPGTDLKFGERAVVDHRVRGKSTLLEITVRSARRGELKDFAGFNLSDPYQRKAHYYYVPVRVKNVGERRLGGIDVPLWGISGDNTLLPPVQFTSSFKKCPTEPLPKKFGPGKRHQTCLVFLSPNKGTLEGVSYRPEESFDPIEWRGRVQGQGNKKSGGDKGGGNKGGDNGGNNNGGNNSGGGNND